MNKTIPEVYQDDMDDDEMLPEYDFTGGVRGKHYRAYRRGYTVTIHHADGTSTVQHFKPEADTVALEPYVQKYFPDSEAVKVLAAQRKFSIVRSSHGWRPTTMNETIRVHPC